MTLSDFLTRFGDALAERVTTQCQILHDPVRDARQDPDLDARLAGLVRPCYPAQAEAAKALAKAFFRAGQRAAYVCGEMGVGKCQIALALLALAPRPLRALVLCPPHLVPKWQREAEAVLPNIQVVDLNGPEALVTLIRLAEARRRGTLRPPDVPEVWVLGRERAKLHHAWRPAFLTRWQWRWAQGTLLTWRDPACLRCGQCFIDDDGMPLPVAALQKNRFFCPACREPAFGADPMGPRRYAPAEFIKRHLKGVFDFFIADEVHELKGEDTGQGNAFGALTAACRQTLALTGTLLGGYADNLFFLLWRSHPTAMAGEGFQYRGVQRWMERYGVLERITRVRREEAAEDARVVRGKLRGRTVVRRKPGISPVVLGRHLLPTTLFLRLADVAEGLPPYEERVVSLPMSPALGEAYHALETQLKVEVQAALREGSRRLLSRYLQSLLCYPDAAAFREEVVVDPRVTDRQGQTVILAAAPQVPGPLPKEEALLALCEREVRQAGRRVLVYVVFTETRDLTPRLSSLLEEAGFQVAILKGSVAPVRREAWIQDRVHEGVEILLANPELVKTGLDLYAFPTFVFYETGYSIYTLRQAARRAWRIGQTAPCQVAFFVYQGTMQEQALKLIATKLDASLAIEGELTEAGLTALADPSDALVLELARALVERVGNRESAEAVWARLRTREREQALPLTAFPPTPPVERLTEPMEGIGQPRLLVDLIETLTPRRWKLRRIEVPAQELEALLQAQPARAQLALF